MANKGLLSHDELLTQTLSSGEHLKNKFIFRNVEWFIFKISNSHYDFLGLYERKFEKVEKTSTAEG